MNESGATAAPSRGATWKINGIRRGASARATPSSAQRPPSAQRPASRQAVASAQRPARKQAGGRRGRLIRALSHPVTPLPQEGLRRRGLARHRQRAVFLRWHTRAWMLASAHEEFASRAAGAGLAAARERRRRRDDGAPWSGLFGGCRRWERGGRARESFGARPTRGRRLGGNARGNGGNARGKQPARGSLRG